MIYDDQLHDERIAFVYDGDVVYRNGGHPAPWRALVKRRWGWPKGAAYRAADYLRDAALAYGERPVLWLAREQRLAQVEQAVRNCPGLVSLLAEGLAANAGKDARDAGKPMTGFTVQFDSVVREDGLLRYVLGALATRFGTSIDVVRSATRFNTTGNDGQPLDHAVLRVSTAGMEEP